jgi:colanic acid biosynthesis glycosyl transferase WcaI
MSGKVWIVSELYYPEETSTGYLLTKIAEGLAEHRRINVLCAQPTYSARGVRAPSQEERNGVTIYRCRATTFDKNKLLLRLINLVTISLSIFLQAVRKIGKQDCVVVVTNPPLLPFLVAFACSLRGAKCLLLVHDVYPEVLIASGISQPHSVFTRLIAWLNRRLYGNVERIIILGRDMERIVSKKFEKDSRRTVIITNWADLDQIFPSPRNQNSLLEELGLSKKFVIQYAGNMGRTHGLESLLESARRLSEIGDVHFLFIGSGAKKRWLEEAVANHEIRNITLLGNRPRSDQSNFLNACDVTVISFMPGMAGISVPSRMYNILAAGKPIIAVADSDSELALVVKEEGVGWIVPPDQPDKVVEAILDARAHPECVAEMGMRARAVAENKYSLSKVIESYTYLINSIDDNQNLRDR